MNKKGQLIVVSGPSGVGKGTVLKEYLASRDQIAYSVSATTRAPRVGEIDGKTRRGTWRSLFLFKPRRV